MARGWLRALAVVELARLGRGRGVMAAELGEKVMMAMRGGKKVTTGAESSSQAAAHSGLGGGSGGENEECRSRLLREKE